MDNVIRVCEWPDGTWCDEEDVEDYLKWMSDDYRVLCFPTYQDYEEYTENGRVA